VKRTLIDLEHPQLSVVRQGKLLGVARSSWYDRPLGESAENLELMRRMDEQYTQTPCDGIRRMTAWLRQQGDVINPKRVGRLLRLMGVEALYPKLSQAAAERAWSAGRRCETLSLPAACCVASR
jgi:putative transposase